MENIINLEERKGPARPLLGLIEESMKLMRAYIESDSDGEIIMHGQPVNVHIPAPPNYDHVLQAIEEASESKYCYFKQLGAFVPDYISKREFEKLFNEYENLRLECERYREESLR